VCGRAIAPFRRIVRFLLGGVSFSEGVQKFLFPAALGWDVFRRA
jgi:hypothetical protein